MYKDENSPASFSVMHRDSIQFDVVLDFFAVVVVVSKRVENLCQAQMRQIAEDFFRAFPKFPAFHDGADRCTGIFNDGLPA